MQLATVSLPSARRSSDWACTACIHRRWEAVTYPLDEVPAVAVGVEGLVVLDVRLEPHHHLLAQPVVDGDGAHLEARDKSTFQKASSPECTPLGADVLGSKRKKRFFSTRHKLPASTPWQSSGRLELDMFDEFCQPLYLELFGQELAHRPSPRTRTKNRLS